MSNAISRLMLALVVLGFLASTTMNMYGDMKRLEAENQKLSHELGQLRSQYETIIPERDALLADNANLKSQFNAIQTAYLAENQARLKAESDVETYKGMVLNMANDGQAVSPAACAAVGPQVMNPEALVLSTIAPVGVSSLITLAVVGLIVAIINYSRKQKKLRSLPPQIRNLR
jgi:regulator of replication initiation timing